MNVQLAGWNGVPQGVVAAEEYSEASLRKDITMHVVHSRSYLGDSIDDSEFYVDIILKMAELTCSMPRMGGSRAAFLTSNKEVVKVAFTKAGTVQNKIEAALSKQDWRAVRRHWKGQRMGTPWEFVEETLKDYDYNFPIAHSVLSTKYESVGAGKADIISQEAVTPIMFYMESDIPTEQKRFWSLMSNHVDVVQLGLRESTGEVVAYDF